MRNRLGLLGAALIVALATPLPAAAQARVPDAGMWGLGFKAGVSMPFDDALSTAFDMGVSLEGYVTPRVSIRGQVAGTWFDIKGRPFGGTVSPMAMTGNLVYNWELGKWHPFATGGLGIYRVRFDENDLNSSDTKLGVDFGGGMEYFFTRRDVLIGEMTVHFIGDDRVDSARSDYESRYWTILGGYKRYF